MGIISSGGWRLLLMIFWRRGVVVVIFVMIVLCLYQKAFNKNFKLMMDFFESVLIGEMGEYILNWIFSVYGDLSSTYIGNLYRVRMQGGLIRAVMGRKVGRGGGRISCTGHVHGQLLGM